MNQSDDAVNMRPSRDRVLAQGQLFWTEVDILNIQDDAQILRRNLEQFGVKVNLYNVAVASGIQKVLGQNDSKAEYIIINAHGDTDEGFVHLPELSAEIAAQQPFHSKMTAEDLAKFVHVEGKTVITTACGGGHTKLADVFMEVGKAKTYIGDTAAPFGYVSNLFPTLIFYFLTRYSLDIKTAFDRAQACDAEEFKTWQLRAGNP